jgi:4-aminobutyrate aminotransferase-like enzyme
MSAPAIDALMSRRQRLLGPTYGLFYREPVHLVRAQGVWMYDPEDRAYLDVYNNVPVVGHGHPRIVEALVGQARRLNTHTRYLTDSPLELSETLLKTLPREIAHTIFTCTGSEANDLAIRMVRLATAGQGIIVSERAYHGNTSLTAGVSPSSRRAPLGPDIFAVPAPIGADGGAAFVEAVRGCVAGMEAKGVKLAAMLVDTAFSSDGVVVDPPGFLKDAADVIRRAGGLFIADEVQPGHARTGAHMWGFQHHGIIPDVVTMGKPMGNGHPIGCLAARHDLMEVFSKQSRYFNTFGGNTVSCAVGLAVLNVIAEEKLQDNARMVGTQLREGLKSLARQHDLLGEVRGMGLYYGVDVNAGRFQSPGEAAGAVVNHLRDEGVLIGATGRDGMALKIRPPLVFSRENCEFFLGKLERTLRAVS